MQEQLDVLRMDLEGELLTDQQTRILYATDASVYRELPLAVALPKTVEDIGKLIHFADRQGTSLIPRTAGTSLAGQVVGAGIVVDVSKHFTDILEVNVEEQWVRVQPGVVRDELNLFLRQFGLFFAPETSTANRAMVGGMVGNNSCGANSLIYYSTREHTLELDVYLSDGTQVKLKDLTFDEFIAKCELPTLEGRIYRDIREMLGRYENQGEIRREFPKPDIRRRNTGYAIDMLLESDPFTAGTLPFNFCKLICGSEGTLAFITEIKLRLERISTDPSALLCVHFHTLDDALRANLIALQYQPRGCELMDHYILDCTANNLEQHLNRSFIQGNPAAVLMIEYDGRDEDAIRAKVLQVERHMSSAGLGYFFPLIWGDDKRKAWDLRKAGLGLLSNMPGDAKPVAVIEDTAVSVEDLPAYIKEFNLILQQYDLYAVHYAHVATGELHLRPILNLKTVQGTQLFREIALEIAHLVKRYKGSLSGEHGDGRLRGEFIAMMIGQHNYDLLKRVKQSWDPKGIFNPGKIVDSPSMNTSLRYDAEVPVRSIPSVFRYEGQSILQHVEQCNGSGDCRKSHLSGGTMCPSYMATLDEKDTTRARANILREFLTHSTRQSPYDHAEIKEVMDLCLSCKGCKIECPSSVDMAKLKADFLQGYHDANGLPLKTRMVAHVDKITQFASSFSRLYNWSIQNRFTAPLIKSMVGFAEERHLPQIAHESLRRWFKIKDKPIRNQGDNKGQVYFFCDEFTNYNDVEIGKKAILLLEHLGYEVLMVDHAFSGRALLSKGLLRAARKLANRNVELFSTRLSADIPLLAVEPSTILTFRDEYVDLVDEELVEDATRIAPFTQLLEEFLFKEFLKKKIAPASFKQTKDKYLLHGHCQQKAWKLQSFSSQIISALLGAEVETIASGCCGMAGSFGYEKKHYELSMKIGELVLFPAVRAKAKNTTVLATGTSCRHQIVDGTGERAYHPVEILYEAILHN